MSNTRRRARAVLTWFAPLFVILIVVQVLLAGEGIFGLENVKKLDAATTLDAHRLLGFILSEPLALLFLIAALLAWDDDMRVRRISIAAPILTFVQQLLAEGGRWVGALHPLNAFIVLGMFGWLSGRYHRRRRVTRDVPAPAAASGD